MKKFKYVVSRGFKMVGGDAAGGGGIVVGGGKSGK